MKKFYLLSLAVALLLGACHKNKDISHMSNSDSDPLKSKTEEMVEQKLAEIGNFDAEEVTKLLFGEWVCDTIITYDKEWCCIEDIYLLFGEHYAEGVATPHYLFYGNGEMLKCVRSTAGPDEPYSLTYNQWNYDSKSKTITVVYEIGKECEYKVVGIGQDYMMLDYYDATNKRNTRLGLKCADMMIWDIVYPVQSFVVLDNEGNNIFESDPDSMYDFTITLNDKVYNYEGLTRALPIEPLALYTDNDYPYRLNFGDFYHNDKGCYTIIFRDKEWSVEYVNRLDIICNELFFKNSFKIDGEEVECIKIGDANVGAYPLYL